jgi:uncharacterized protein with ParB-like and HNH nuclease domain
MDVGILPPELRTIEQLFTGDTRYTVPKYQRSFAWKTDEVQELWEDILSSVDRGGDYFLGTVVLHKRNDGLHEIIDGQQRLACISMIFSAIRNLFLRTGDKREGQIMISFLGAKGYKRESHTTPKLVLNHINDEHFVQYVIESKNAEDVEKALRLKGIQESNKLLLQAYQYFLTSVSSEAGKRGADVDAFIVPLIDCLRNAVKLIAIPVASEDDANLFFESLNARGKELAISDLVKNRLYLEAKDQVVRAQVLWDQMETALSRRPIPEYLRHYWIAKKTGVGGINVREKQLYRMISQEVKGKKPQTIKLLEDLRSSAGDYAKIWDYTLWPDEDAYDMAFEDTLKELRLFRVTQCNPLLLNSIQRFKKPKDIARTFSIIVNFSFRYFIIGNQSSGNLERESGKIAYGIREGTYSNPSQVADAFRAINPDSSFRSDFSLAKIPPSRAKLARYILAKINNYVQQQSGKEGPEVIANPDAKQVKRTTNGIIPFTGRYRNFIQIDHNGNTCHDKEQQHYDEKDKGSQHQGRIIKRDRKHFTVVVGDQGR